MRVAVIGAGISGLACACRLAERGADVAVFDLASRVGGVIASSTRNGFLFELGPQSFQTTAALNDLIRAAGLSDECDRAPARSARYIYAAGRLHRVPLGPQILVSGSLLGFGARLRLWRDIVGNSHPPDREESLGEFVRRKFGAQLLDRLAGPFVSGIYAGDPERLGLRDTFPDFYRWEKENRSILRGAMKAMRARKGKDSGKPSPGFLAMRRGNGSLLDALAAKLGDQVHLGASVESVSRTSSGPGFQLVVRSATGAETVRADSVVVASPTDAAARMLAGLAPRIAERLSRIEYAPVAVVGTGYRREQIGRPLEGFGFLVARSESRKLLGTVWMSSLFPGRAPEGQVNLTSFVGGATDPATTQLPEAEIAAIVERELGEILEIRGSATERSVWVHRRALPQYNIGHRRGIAEIRDELRGIPGLHLAGNYLDGPSTGVCVETAFRAADLILSQKPEVSAGATV